MTQVEGTALLILRRVDEEDAMNNSQRRRRVEDSHVYELSDVTRHHRTLPVSPDLI